MPENGLKWGKTNQWDIVPPFWWNCPIVTAPIVPAWMPENARLARLAHGPPSR